MSAAENQEPVEALAANRPDPAFGVRPRLRCAHRRLDQANAVGAEDLVELACELAVAVTDQKPRLDVLIAKLHQQVARLLGHPATVRVGRDPGDADAPGRKFDEEQHVEPLEEERVDGEEVALEDAPRLRTQELRPTLLKPFRRRLNPRISQDRPDGARPQLDSQPDHLTLDPPVAPTRVLPSEADDELPDAGAGRRPAKTPMRIRPAARDQLAMPPQ